ncbi:hypothetical protein [Streptomyces sp. NPDC002758]
MRKSRGVGATALALVMVTGVSGAAVAGGAKGSPSPSGSVSAHAPSKQGEKGKQTDWLAQLAKRYGVSVAQLENSLRDVKRAIGEQGKSPSDQAIARLLAHDLGISQAKAAKLAQEVFGQAAEKRKAGQDGKGAKADSSAFVDGLAKHLGVSHEQAARAFAALEKLSRTSGGIDPRDARFAAIARGLGVTAKQFADAIGQVKMSLVGEHQAASAQPSKS